MKSKLNRLYLFQRQNITLTDAVDELEKELSETERDITKVVHQHYAYAVEYAIPAFGEEIRIFSVNLPFVDYLLPGMYRLVDFPLEHRETMEKLMSQLEIGSFIIELPGQLSDKNREYLVKLLGISLGGYYSKLSDVPSHGVLNKREHIYIKPFRQQGEDIIDNLEQLLKKYTK